MNDTISTQPKFLQIFAHIISYVFHPVFFPVLMTLFIYKLSPQSFVGFNMVDFGKQPFPLLAPIFLNTLFFPLVAVLLIKAVGLIESIQMHTSKDRIIPLIATMIFYFWAYQVMDETLAPFYIRVLMLGCFWLIIALFMINIFFKISMHTAAAGGAVAMISILMFHSSVNMAIPLFITIIIAGIIGTARLILSAHSSSQTWLGYIIGFVVQMGAYWYLG